MKNTTQVCGNLDHNSTTESFWMLKDDEVIHGQVVASFALLYLAIGLPWNFLVVITILKEHLFYQPTILILLNLVLVDIFMLLLYIPHIIVSGIAGGYPVGENNRIRCGICWLSLLSIALIMNSLFTVAFISVDRLLFIIKPLRYEKIVSIPRTLLAIGILATISLLLSLISLVRYDDVVYEPRYLTCTVHSESIDWFHILLIAIACVALVVILVCNIWVVCIVWKNIRTVYKSHEGKTCRHNTEDKVNKKRHKKQLHLFRVFGALILSSIISWVPHMITFLITMHTEVNKFVFTASEILFLAQVVVHPILETSLINDVRKPIKKMVTCGLSKKKVCSKHREECNHEPSKHGFRFWLNLLNAAILHKSSIASKLSFKRSGQNDTSSDATKNLDVPNSVICNDKSSGV